MLEQTVKDAQTVTSDGDRVQDPIDGVVVRHATTHADRRETGGRGTYSGALERGHEVRQVKRRPEVVVPEVGDVLAAG